MSRLLRRRLLSQIIVRQIERLKFSIAVEWYTCALLTEYQRLLYSRGLGYAPVGQCGLDCTGLDWTQLSAVGECPR